MHNYLVLMMFLSQRTVFAVVVQLMQIKKMWISGQHVSENK